MDKIEELLTRGVDAVYPTKEDLEKVLRTGKKLTLYQACDPSGKSKARETFFTNEELRSNATDYVKQAAKVVRFEGENAIEIKYNGDWLNKLALKEILDIAGHFTLQQLIERDLFQERMK